MPVLTKSAQCMNTSAIAHPLPHSHMNHGGHPEKEMIKLKAGKISLIYQNGSLRYISNGDNEIIRMIYSAVRDKEWLTIEPVISGEKFDINSDSFRIEYECLYRSEEIAFSALYKIEGHSDSTLIFSFEGEALNSFEKSRIGFCILHPVECCAGKPCQITHSDGSSETILFPFFISPDLVFTDIKSMKWNAHAAECVLNFEGDIFETEDQRNWTDASYKTYCTPQNMPCPAKVSKGEKISQRIEFKLGRGDAEDKSDRKTVQITINPQGLSARPLIGVGRSTRHLTLTENEMRILSNIPFDHYRVDLFLFRSDWKEEADKAAKEAAGLNYKIELVLFFDEHSSSQLDDFIKWFTDLKPEISVITIFQRTEAATSGSLLETIAPALKRVLPSVRIGCGTNANYAQVNRNVPESENADYLCYSVHPQEHASDNTTLVENLQGQAYTVESAFQFANGKGIWVSPVNLQRRFNANIENYERPVSLTTFPPQVDSRIMSLFGACWTAGSIKYIGEAGAKAITYYETAGERGIIQGDYDSRWPEEFKTAKGMLFPVYHLFNYILKDKSYGLVQCRSSRPLIADCLALSDGQRIKMVFMNFTSEGQKILCSRPSGKIKVKMLNAGTFSDATFDPEWIEKGWESRILQPEEMTLEPYSLTFLEGLL
jgi:D-apionolactonase